MSIHQHILDDLPARAHAHHAPPAMSEVRCSCAVCGAHVMGWAGYSVVGSCGNCGSYDIHPLPGLPVHPRA